MDTLEEKYPIVMENYYAVKCLKVNFPTKNSVGIKVVDISLPLKFHYKETCVRLGS